MSSKSNDNGRAYEYSYLLTLKKLLETKIHFVIEENSSFFASKHAWNNTPNHEREHFLESAEAGIETLLELEPLILEDKENVLNICIQPDSKGVEGDVRDILLIRDDISWGIGLSVKNNHFAVKHSRLSNKIDFAHNWFGEKCTDTYWNDIEPIFDYLNKEKAKARDWRDLPNKNEDVYVPLLAAFIKEIKVQYEIKGHIIPTKMVEYLLGNYDFYKMINLNSKKITQTHTYNLRGTLNKSGKFSKPKIIIPKSSLPTRIISLEFKHGSQNTVELYLDAGWSFSFRIHNAATKVEASLKFDVQILGMPATILVLNNKW